MKVFKRSLSRKKKKASNEDIMETIATEQIANSSIGESKVTRDIREPSYHETYTAMCRSLERFSLDSRRYDGCLKRLLNTISPSEDSSSSVEEVTPCPFDQRRFMRRGEWEGDGVNIGRPSMNTLKAVAKDRNPLGECVYPLENVEGVFSEFLKVLPKVGLHALRMDNVDFDVPSTRTRENGKVREIHELLGADPNETPLSPYCRKYLELSSYIPPLSALCKAAIKNVISPRRQFDCYGLSNLRDLLCLPDWLKHESLTTKLPPAARYQLLNVLLAQNCNNNHPVSAGEPDNAQNNNKKKSMCPSTGSIPLGEAVSFDDKKSGTRIRNDPSAILRRRERRKEDRYFLMPIGSVSTQGLSKGVQSWLDVASIIHQGTYTHKNLDSKAQKQALHTTLPAGMLTAVLVKNKIYSVRPIRAPMISMKTLLDKNASKRMFAETHAKFVGVTLLLALQFLHTHEVLHGTLCPRKVLFNDRGYPCLTGFGSAEIIDDRQGRPRERTEPTYTSPEQLYYEYLTELTDIWSLGVLVYHMVYGKPPHEGKDPAETRRNISNRKFIPTFEPEEMSSDGRAFIMRCIRRDECRRFSLLHLKRSLSESVPWFERLNEDKLYRQVVPSPLLSVINEL